MLPANLFGSRLARPGSRSCRTTGRSRASSAVRSGDHELGRGPYASTLPVACRLDSQGGHLAATCDGFDRHEVRRGSARAIHPEGVDLSLVSLCTGVVTAHAVHAKEHAALAKNAGLALDPRERPVLVVDEQVVARCRR